MIHLLLTDTNKTFCGDPIQNGSVGTYERPRFEDCHKVCQKCRIAYNEATENEHQQWLAREAARIASMPPREQFHDWLVDCSRLWESDMGAMGYLIITAATFGLALPVVNSIKWSAKKLLQLGV